MSSVSSLACAYHAPRAGGTFARRYTASSGRTVAPIHSSLRYAVIAHLLLDVRSLWLRLFCAGLTVRVGTSATALERYRLPFLSLPAYLPPSPPLYKAEHRDAYAAFPASLFRVRARDRWRAARLAGGTVSDVASVLLASPFLAVRDTSYACHARC